jgi:hypothetical protein
MYSSENRAGGRRPSARAGDERLSWQPQPQHADEALHLRQDGDEFWRRDVMRRQHLADRILGKGREDGDGNP